MWFTESQTSRLRGRVHVLPLCIGCENTNVYQRNLERGWEVRAERLEVRADETAYAGIKRRYQTHNPPNPAAQTTSPHFHPDCSLPGHHCSTANTVLEHHSIIYVALHPPNRDLVFAKLYMRISDQLPFVPSHLLTRAVVAWGAEPYKLALGASVIYVVCASPLKSGNPSFSSYLLLLVSFLWGC